MVVSHGPDASRARDLDDLLNALEEAHARGESKVPARIASRMRRFVPGVSAEMLIRDAIDAIFTLQERRRRSVVQASAGALSVFGPDAGVNAEISGSGGHLISRAIDVACARALTARIRNAAHRVCVLLLEAHERRAWASLGYQTWDAYVKHEFGFSRTRSYELLDHGRVVLALKAASGMSGIPDISTHAAGKLKPYLPQVVDQIRDRLAAPGCNSSPADVVHEVVLDMRRPSGLGAGQFATPEPFAGGYDAVGGRPSKLSVDRLRAALDCLAQIPCLEQLVAAARVDPELRASLSEASQRLEDFERAWATTLGVAG